MRYFMPFDLAPYPNIRAYLQRIAGREAYQRAMHKGDPGMTLDELRELFRRRALASGLITGLLAFAALGLASSEAPLLFHSLVDRAWSLPFHLVTGAVAVGTSSSSSGPARCRRP